MQICTNIPHVQVVTMALDMFPFWRVTVDDLQVLIKVQVQFTGFAHIDSHAKIVAILETRVKILCWHPTMWTDAKQVVKTKTLSCLFHGANLDNTGSTSREQAAFAWQTLCVDAFAGRWLHLFKTQNWQILQMAGDVEQ